VCPRAVLNTVVKKKNSQPLLGLKPPIIQPVAQRYTIGCTKTPYLLFIYVTSEAKLCGPIRNCENGGRGEKFRNIFHYLTTTSHIIKLTKINCMLMNGDLGSVWEEPTNLRIVSFGENQNHEKYSSRNSLWPKWNRTRSRTVKSCCRF